MLHGLSDTSPSVSYHSNQLRCELVRLLNRIQSLHQEGADIESFLQERIYFDFVSLSRMGLKREQLMQESVSASIMADEPVTQGVIVDIENFRSKEHLPEKFTFE